MNLPYYSVNEYLITAVIAEILLVLWILFKESKERIINMSYLMCLQYERQKRMDVYNLLIFTWYLYLLFFAVI